MTNILIVDTSKPSVVMTSEIFKDKIPGCVVHVAANGKESLELLGNLSPDLCVVDFDLPDVDGPSLIDAMRKEYSGPILLTAYPDAVVKQAVDLDLFTYTDASAWLVKPLKVRDLADRIDTFIDKRRRTSRRFESNIEAQLIGKASGRGKRAPKVGGHLENISHSGVCVKIEGAMKMKKKEEVLVSLRFPASGLGSSSPKKSIKNTKNTATKKVAKNLDTKIKATVCWVEKGRVGLEFARLSDIQKKGLMSYLRQSFENNCYDW